MVLFGFQAHDHGEPKPADAPDNLFAPLDGHDTARDGFDAGARPRSLCTALQRHPSSVGSRWPPMRSRSRGSSSSR